MSTLVLLSGGVDSAAVATLDADHALFVGYGQPVVAKECAAAARVAQRLGIPFSSVSVVGLDTSAMHDAAGPGARVVPGRNAVLLAVAAARAAGLGLDTVRIGAIADDHADYSDCRPAFVDALSSVLIAAYGVRVEAPLAMHAKVRAVELCLRAGVLDLTWSCYVHGPKPCGTCNSCVSRASAISAAHRLGMTP